MHIPPSFLETDPEYIRAFVRRNAFGTLITWDGRRPVATRLLFNLSDDSQGKRILSGHIARANPQSRTFGMNEEVLVQFDGPHAYISASWYSVRSVPTWNYITVQAYGTLQTIDTTEELHELLKETVESQERHAPEQERYRLESLPVEMLHNMMKAIVGFRITVSTMECAAKLSQNQNPRDHDAIVARLRERKDDASAAVAAEMEARRKKM